MFWITNAIPSQLALVNWKLKFVVKLCTFTAVVKKQGRKWRYIVDHASTNPAAPPSPACG